MEISNQPGISLRAARESAGWSVTDVVQRTKFPRSIVEALEKDDYTVFSSPTYAKSYLSQYAEFLGVDPTSWLDYFEPARFAPPKDMRSMIESPAAPEAHRAGSGARNGGSSHMAPAILLILITGGLIYGAVVGYAYLEKNLGGSTVHPLPAPPAVATPESGSAIPAAPSQPAQARQDNPADAGTPASAEPAGKPTEQPKITPRATIVVEE